jgi:predicted RecA/RadA family phage recombinase
MKTFVQKGDVLTLTPTAAVLSGVGFLFGVSLFGIATNDVAINAPGEFITEGVVDIGKTAGLAVTAGDRLFWDPVGKVVNKTAAAQQCVGIAVADAIAGAATVRMKIGPVTAVGA